MSVSGCRPRRGWLKTLLASCANVAFPGPDNAGGYFVLEGGRRGYSRKRCDRQGTPCLAKFCTRLSGSSQLIQPLLRWPPLSPSSHHHRHVCPVLLRPCILLSPPKTKETVSPSSSPRSHPHSAYRQQQVDARATPQESRGLFFLSPIPHS